MFPQVRRCNRGWSHCEQEETVHRIAERKERSRELRRDERRTQDAIQNLVETLESLANPLESLRVRLQAASQSVAKRASELGVLLVHYSNPILPDDQQMVSLPVLNKLSTDVLLASY